MAGLALPQQHPDYPVLAPIVSALYRHAGGMEPFAEGLARIFRQAVDEVVDAPRTNRFTLSELEKTEKTYLGTKIEILVRDFLQIKKGSILDLSVDGVEVDIKNTTKSAWTIPLESHGHPALLLRLDEKIAKCDAGIAVIRPEYLNASENRDSKKTLSKAGVGNIWWMLYRHPYPPNFWEVLPAADRLEVFAAGTATKRLAALFEKLQRTPISRLQVQAVAQQDDYMKRLRKNGGARDLLQEKGMVLLSGRSDPALIERLGLGRVSPSEFISLKPEPGAETELLQTAGLLP